MFDGDSLPYNRDVLRREYEAAAREAGTSDLKAVTSKMRAAQGGSS